ncbi:N-methylhydantoinase B/acetone carboxylase, alpha subunit [Thioflavicoccus mobilis 8321]|uniref:N-methylhydantoinase B/acetone carboxylase, alpha subunit n=1 Tax=Thioflavicoccus mobilis 8321 TaxID=765912 RepID=L0GZ38_9GAMM|nr:hydantoinase B/oxoprolinase family protein [Thioflavicoccus mobilis]AGA92008.1 N-methylhydantoinase B/acetone carboxylase, alpha subunit [Thioflavicoccus mobilis 8321]
MNPIELSLFASRLDAVCDEMGAVLRNAAFSTNIRDRLDYSCAVFDAAGGLCAQAAHIPVHLGSMAFAMTDLVAREDWVPGDMVIVNDPFLGGTHLPDVTLIAPVFSGGERVAFVVNRAHHADIGAASPGSMPVSRTLDEEGQVIAPRHLIRAGILDEGWLARLVAATRRPGDARGDFLAQVSANRAGAQRVAELVGRFGTAAFLADLAELNDYGERLARRAIGMLPAGVYRFTDWMDDDGQGTRDVRLQVAVRLADGEAAVDFSGSAAQVVGNINCPLAVTAAAVFYAFRCLMPAQTPACAGALRPIRLSAPSGCLLNARSSAAVAAGNVETSSRVVDLVLGALAQAAPERIPAASQGTMNNLAMGNAAPGAPWDYYETLGGGMGAGSTGGGWSGVQTHMTNTLNTPIEVLETRFPLRVRRYGLRSGSGGAGRRRGGEGLVRELELLAPAHATLLTERRHRGPWGVGGGGPGQPGRNLLNGESLPAKVAVELVPGDRLRIETPGGGGWGEA